MEHLSKADPVSRYELKSDVLNELVSSDPGVLIRFGLLIFGLIILFIIFLAALINYPNYVLSEARIFSSKASTPVFIPDGLLTCLTASEGQSVKSGSVLAVLDVDNYKPVLEIEKRLDKVKQYYERHDLDSLISMIETQVTYLGALKTDAVVFKESLNKNLKILNQRSQLSSVQNSDLIKSIALFHSRILDWKNKYIITAPADGTVTYRSYFFTGQYLKNGQLFCIIIPRSDNYYAESTISSATILKIKLGSVAYCSFGALDKKSEYLKGRVTFISKVLSDNGYQIKIDFDHGLMTNENNKVEYREGMITDLKIINNDVSLLKRLSTHF